VPRESAGGPGPPFAAESFWTGFLDQSIIKPR
jgi:hypothetical protein